MKKWHLPVLFISLAIAAFAAVSYYWPKLKAEFSETDLIEYADAYKVENLSSALKDTYAQISFRFSASELSLHQAPQYEIKETPEQAQTQIIFNNVQAPEQNFTYEEITNNPLIQDVSQTQVGDAFVLTMKRKGPLAPVEVSIQGDTATIKIPFGDASYPKFSDLTPADGALARPGWQKIQTRVALSEPLKKGFLFLNGQPQSFQTKDLGFGQYLFETSANLSVDQDYTVTAIAIDIKDRASEQSWNFGVQKSVLETTLGANRFEYLGWWGQISSSSVPVMAGPSSTSTKLSVFSQINRVKVLKEVEGEMIDDSNLWLQIDGGAHPGAYIFSKYVTSIAQPKPPVNFKIPDGVAQNDYWIDVDITKKILTLFQYDKPVFATYISPGLAASPTLGGTYRIWYKILKTRMHGGPPVATHFYDLPNVPYVMYYNGSFAVHGTYWHDKFGTRQSAGCTNLTQGDAKFIFEKVNPILSPDKKSVLSNAENPGTVVFNHF